MKTKSRTHGKFTFSGDYTMTGIFEMPFAGTVYPIGVGVAKVKDIFLNPENERIGDMNVDGSFSKAGQGRLIEAYTESDEFAAEGEALGGSIEENGGVNDPIWVQFRDGRLVSEEGNRRIAQVKTMDGDEFAQVPIMVFPDEMPQKDINWFKDQRHVAAVLAWSSAVRSKRAYELFLSGMNADQIQRHLGFKSVRDAKKYIHSYVWLRDSGLTPEHFSKMFHAYIPTLRDHFGYDEDTQKFDNSKRKAFEPRKESKAKAPPPPPEKVDEIAGCKTDFKWFVNLIKTGRVTDCRHSDGIIAPAIRQADRPYGPRLFEIINSDAGDLKTKGKKNGELCPAEQAWRYLRERLHGSSLYNSTDNLVARITEILESASQTRSFATSTYENRMLRTRMAELVEVGKKFLSDTAPKK